MSPGDLRIIHATFDMQMARSSVIHSLILIVVILQLLLALTTSSPHTAYNSAKSKRPPKSFGYYENWNFIKTEKEHSKPKWTYKDQLNWPHQFPTCGTKRQSPIDIQPKETVLAAFPNFVFHNYGHINNMTLVNNGHTVAINLPDDYPKHKTPHITGGGLNGTYNFAQIHMHWGVDSTLGSEHRIKSRSHPLELHIVHWNSKYGSFAKASTNAVDGLAVLSILAEVGLGDSKALMPISDQLGEIIKNGDETVLRKPIALLDVMPKQKSSFFRYFGSVTTPTCNEIVTWSVFDNFIEISEKQLAKFRNLKDEHGERLVNNFRMPQPLNDRTVYYRSFTGCEISRDLSDATSMADAFKWTKCLMSYAFNSIFSSS